MADGLSSGRRLPKRVRNELHFRRMSVADKKQIAEQFWRVTFHSEQLAGFDSPGFDDHSKLFFPNPQSGELLLPQATEEGILWPEGARPVARDYTPLFFDGTSTLTIDFYRHEAGVASEWAEQAAVGDQLAVGGPRGSLIVPVDYATQVYVFDETGLPAMQRRLAQAQGKKQLLLAFCDKALAEAYLGELPAGTELICLGHGRMDGDGVAECLTHLQALTLPTDDYFIWLTGEGESVKALSDYFTEQRNCHPGLVRAVAYWHRKGE